MRPFESTARLASLVSDLQSLEKKANEVRAEIARITQAFVHPVNGTNGSASHASAASLSPMPKEARGHSARILALIGENPGARTSWLAEKVYGEDTTETRRKVSALMSYMRRTKKLIRKAKGGGYELEV
jgi:hypothetical protein